MRSKPAVSRSLLLPLLLFLCARASGLAAQHPHPDAHVHPPAGEDARTGSTAVLPGVSPGREGSGTSWLPDATPMHALHSRAGSWELMLHGNLFLQYIDEGSDRGSSQLGSINWIMGMARRPLAGGSLALRTMLSAEPWTVGECGYPDLLATGEFCNGTPIHDRQHPHDLFMEVAASYQRALNEDVAVEIYGGPAADPALGPTAYPHRVSAYPGPLAPITHHWLDASHISFGSLTGGLFGRAWKLEGSLFNGREPDENRLDFDLAPLDSYAARGSFLPTDRWALQLSAGRLREAEPGHEPGEERVDVTRYTASAIYHQPLGQGGVWASTAAVGRNVEEGTGTNAILLESSLTLSEGHILSARAEWAEKTGHDLALEDHDLEDDVFRVAKVAIGYSLQLSPTARWVPALGAGASLSLLPDALRPFYGETSPAGLVVFASLRPRSMIMHGGAAATPAATPAAMPHH